ncbi:MAG TPA: hypothetical protein VFD01_14940 [Candidatus Dormibacteraeota bacterium]|jgi:hypothetical protein|nr:hypothetical protein [Candidatus Dormibacteraeota bacterium]
MQTALLAAIFLHSGGGVDSFLELVAMAGPFAIILGLGIWLILPPIVKAQGERYLFREYVPDARRTGTGPANGNNGANGGRHLEPGHAPAVIEGGRSPASRSKLHSN